MAIDVKIEPLQNKRCYGDLTWWNIGQMVDPVAHTTYNVTKDIISGVNIAMLNSHSANNICGCAYRFSFTTRYKSKIFIQVHLIFYEYKAKQITVTKTLTLMSKGLKIAKPTCMKRYVKKEFQHWKNIEKYNILILILLIQIFIYNDISTWLVPESYYVIYLHMYLWIK